MPHAERPTDDSITGLLGDIAFGITQLVKGEFALFRADAQRSMRDATSGLVRLAVAAAMGVVAINLLATGAVAALVAAGLSPVWANIALGGVLILGAFVIIRSALALIAPLNLVPKQSFSNLRQDAEILKSMGSPHATSDLHP